MSIIAVIPARGGSKRIHKKNIKNFLGRPSISYAIDVAKEVGIFSEIYVSTDDAEVANVAKELGATIPFMRPQNLADDYSTTKQVMSHAVREIKKINKSFKDVCCIYPIAPLVDGVDIRKSYDLMVSSNADQCIPVAKFQSSIFRAFKKSNNQMSYFYPEFEKTRTQDLEESYYDVGQFYWGTYEFWANPDSISTNNVGYEIPSWRVVDIDTEEDWMRAELMYKVINAKGAI